MNIQLEDCGSIILDGIEFHSDDNASALEKLHDHLLSDDVHRDVVLKNSVPLPKYKEYNKETKKDYVTKNGKEKVVRGKDGERKVVDVKTGEEVSPHREKKALREFADNFDFTKGEKAEAPGNDVNFRNEDEAKRWGIEHTDNPAELAAIYRDEEPVEQPLDTKERMIVDYGGLSTNGDSYNQFGDRNKMTAEKRKAYIRKDGPSLDVAAKELSDHYEVEITPQDLVDFMDRFPKGVSEATKLNESDVALEAKDKFKKITGIELNDYTATKAIDAEFEKMQNINSTLLNDSYDTEQQLTNALYDSEAESTKDKGSADTSENGLGKKGVQQGSDTGQKTPPVEPPKPPESLTEEEPEGPFTGIQNSVVNSERLAKNLKPITKEARKKFGTTWDEAMGNVRTGTVDPRSYVSALEKNPSKYPITDLTSAYILMDRIDLTNQKIDAMDRYDKAVKTGNENVEAKAFQDLADIETKLAQNDLVADKVGTITGRALSSRRMLASLDYSLASMKQDISKYYPDNNVPPYVEQRLKEIEEEHAQAMKKLADYGEKWKKFMADQKYDSERKKTSSKSTTNKSEKSITQKGKELADKIRKLKKPPDTLGIDFTLGTWDIAVEGIAKLVEGGAKLADAIDQMIRDKHIGFKDEKDEQAFKDHVLKVEDQTEKSFREKQIDKITELALNGNAETITKDMITPLRRLINDSARAGEESLDKVLDDLHGQLKDSFSDLTKEDMRDAYSGYGDVRLDTKIGLQKKINEWKAEAKIAAQMADVMAGNKPKRGTEKQKNKASEKLEGLRKELQDKMKQQGITWDRPPATPEEKNARALESLKTRVRKEIDDLTNAIANKTDIPERNRTEYDEEVKGLISQRNNLRDTLNTILGKEDTKKQLTDEERISRAEKALDNQIGDLSKDIEKIKAGIYQDPEKRNPVDSINIKLMRGQRDALRELKRKLLVDTSKDSSDSAIALEKYKDTLRNRIMEYSRRLDDNDFEDQPDRKSFVNDAEAKKLELELKRAETEFKQQKTLAERDNRTRLQKIYDKINSWKRFSVLTGIPTIGKLATAVLYRNVVTPIEELVGTGLRLIPGISDLAKMAPREGGPISFRAEKSALMEWAKAESYEDAMRVLKEGMSDTDHMFGKYVSQPPEALEVMGRLHGAMKNFAKRSEFARSYEKRMQHAIDNGADGADELTQLTAMSQAYIDSNRAIFMQDNFLVKKFNEFLNDAERSGKFGPETAAAITRFLVPIVKIPTNFVGETLNYTFGGLRAFEVFGRALTGHIKDMTPEDADGLMRSLKKGSLGVAAMALGYFMPGIAGGVYVRGGTKTDENDPQYGELMIGGLRIPRWATHFPLFEAMQLGSTMRKIHDRDVDKGKDWGSATGDGIIQSSRGLIGEVPLFHTPEELTEAIESGDIMNKFVYPELGSAIPLGIQNVAQFSDVEGGGAKGFVPFSDAKYVKRKPENALDQLQERVPGLRQNVPEK